MRHIVRMVLLAALALGLHGGITARAEDTDTVRITILYDNYRTDERLEADWGFAALVEYGDHVVLFDTGTNGAILLANMEALEVDPARIDMLVLSHEHLDHLGGMRALFAAGAAPDTVFVPPSFSKGLKDDLGKIADVVEVEPGQEIVTGIVTTGELASGPIPEQALLIDTGDGLVVMTGCAHPGIVEVVRAARDLTDRPIVLVMGGFHLLETPTSQIRTIIGDLHDLEVARVAPSHCTGDRAIALFKQDYGEDFVALGVGRVLEFAAPEEYAA